DGIGVIDLGMRLQTQAEETLGQVNTILGNHEVLAVGMQLFATSAFMIDGYPRDFASSWLRNGGRTSDQDQLTDEHLSWLRRLPAMELVGEHLLMHSDTLEYLQWGETREEINATVATILTGDDPEEWWGLWWRLTTRYVYNGEDGGYQAAAMLERLGGSRLVHGHSIIGDLVGAEPKDIDRPYLYADDQVLAIDGGMYDGGPCLVVELPIADEAVLRPADKVAR
ncbi:MAG: serine/threonine protein phosphatase, partial [Nocardioidaceae bacterium]